MKKMTLREALTAELAKQTQDTNPFFETLQFDLICLTSFAEVLADLEGTTKEEASSYMMNELTSKDAQAREQMQKRIQEHRKVVIDYFNEKAA